MAGFDFEDACDNADIIVFLVAHKEFKTIILDKEKISLTHKPLIRQHCLFLHGVVLCLPND